ncbi:Flp pilus assembly protein TadG [Agromyces terreus]|uniref:Flp pilus assembly protein TadG n=1 Tax=Agromyces terreus TaxID=424795 RepID=A0A9X2KF05_9MICO|nr:TadE family type IV pilus minor pilin [Agromyces terreus]MCP2371187.1 Flp pilus assembly protein TadG [Agromyces terreus]
MTAEFAVALPAIMLVLAICLGAVHLVSLEVRLTDAAAAAARALGRGETVDEASRIAARIAGPSSFAASDDGDFACVTLGASGGGLLAPVRLSSGSCAMSGGR